MVTGLQSARRHGTVVMGVVEASAAAGQAGERHSVLALDNGDFEGRAGEVTALLGENGAGKSTLIKLMAGF